MSKLTEPFKEAKKLSKQLRAFRAATEESASLKTNHKAEDERIQIVRNIDWSLYHQLISQLEKLAK